MLGGSKIYDLEFLIADVGSYQSKGDELGPDLRR